MDHHFHRVLAAGGYRVWHGLYCSVAAVYTVATYSDNQRVCQVRMAPSAYAAALAALPVSLIEVRPRRTVAVFTRLNPSATTRIFFVHGSCASMIQFQACIEHFASSCEIVAYDFYGCGRSPKPRDWDAYSFEALKADLVAIMQHYSSSSDKRNIIVAHSAGCALSLAAAADAEPALPLHGLCLMGGFADRRPTHPVFYLPVKVLEYLQPTLSAGFADRALHAKTRKGETAAHRTLLELSAEVSGGNEMHMCKAYYRQMSAPPAEAIRRLGATRLPIMLMAGEADLLVPLASTSALNVLLPTAEMRVVPQTSHQMMQENPEAVCTNVTDLIDRVSQQDQQNAGETVELAAQVAGN